MLELSPWLHRENNSEWDIDMAATRSGPSLFGGYLYGNMTGGGRWVVNLKGIVLGGQDVIDAWYAFKAALDGGGTVVNVPYLDRYTMQTVGSVIFSDGATFSDGAGFWQGAPLTVTVESDAALRATTIRVQTPVAIAAGRPFSILHGRWGWRLYRILRCDLVSTGVYDLTFRTPLREAIKGGDVLIFDQPKCAMRLHEGGVPSIENRRHLGRVDVTFRESEVAVS